MTLRLLVLLVGGIGLMVSPALAQPDSVLHRFEDGNEAYRQGQYEHAADAYEGILDAGYASGALYHNLGNAYTRLDRVGPAIRAYEKARRLQPDDPRLRHNLSHLRRQERLPLAGPPPRGLAALIAGWSPLLLFAVGWLIVSAGLVGAVLRSRRDRPRVWRHPVVWGPLAAGLLLVAVAFGTSYVQAQDERAVVLTEQVPLRPDPDEAAAPDTTLGEGTMLDVQARRARWAQVRLVDQKTGWVPTRALGDI